MSVNRSFYIYITLILALFGVFFLFLIKKNLKELPERNVSIAEVHNHEEKANRRFFALLNNERISFVFFPLKGDSNLTKLYFRALLKEINEQQNN